MGRKAHKGTMPVTMEIKQVSVGFLFSLRWHNDMPVMYALSARNVTEEEAKSIALREMCQNHWIWPRQVLFLRQDGTVTVWDEATFREELSK